MKGLQYVILIGNGGNPSEAALDLARQVQEYLDGGYSLEGGVSITSFSDGPWHSAAQAMTKVTIR